MYNYTILLPNAKKQSQVKNLFYYVYVFFKNYNKPILAVIFF